MLNSNSNVERQFDLETALKQLHVVIEEYERLPQPELTDANGVAIMLNVSYDTIRRMDASGQLPSPIYIGRSKKWRISELKAWLSAGAPGRQKWNAMNN